LKSESEVGKTGYGKTQAITTLCQFRCGVAEVCAVPSAVAVAVVCPVLCCRSGRCDLEWRHSRISLW